MLRQLWLHWVKVGCRSCRNRRYRKEHELNYVETSKVFRGMCLNSYNVTDCGSHVEIVISSIKKECDSSRSKITIDFNVSFNV